MTHQDFSTSLFSAELGIEKEVQHSFSKMNCERGCRNWRCVHLHSIVTRNSDISHANELIKHSTWRLVHCLSAAPLENRQKLQAHRNDALEIMSEDYSVSRVPSFPRKEHSAFMIGACVNDPWWDVHYICCTSDVIYIHCYYAQHIDSCLLLEKYWLSRSKSHSSIVFLICLGSIWCWMLKAEGEVGCELLERVRRKRPGGFVTSPDPLFRTPFKLEGL